MKGSFALLALIFQKFYILYVDTIPNLIYIMRDPPFSTNNYIPRQKAFPLVPFSNSLVRLCFSKRDLSYPKVSLDKWNMLQSKMQTYNTESLTIYIGLGSIVEQNVKHKRTKHS